MFPHRELATQIFEVITSICKYHPRFNAVLFVGGTDLKESVAKYEKEGGQLVIATPGRLLEVKKYREQLLSFKKLEVMYNIVLCGLCDARKYFQRSSI